MKTATKEKDKTKASDKYVGIFPLEFNEGQAGENGGSVIPDTIHLIPIGTWEHDAYGPIIITWSDIREFAQNFNAGIRKGVPITAGHEGYEELPAVGWVSSVEARADGLWGSVEWNKLGKGTLDDKQFKFFSPEFFRDYEDPETHQLYRNVLVGGALTKSPYFKELEAIVFSENKLKFNNTMDLQELLAKDITTLTDEEKAHIKSHASELTEEQKTSHAAVIDEPAEEAGAADDAAAADAGADAGAESDEDKAKGDANEAAGLNRDGSTKEAVQASDKKILLSEVEVKILRDKADRGEQAFKELESQKLTAAVDKLTFSADNKNGRFLPKSKDTVRTFMASLNDKQKESFTALIAQLPTTQIFNESGSGTGVTEGTGQAEIETKVKAKMSENTSLRYSEALKIVMAENKGLEERYDSELVPVSRAKK